MTGSLDALLSPAGQALLAEVTRRLDAGEAPLRVGERLRADHPPDLVAAAMTQHELRRRAAAKFTRAAAMLFTRDGLEQSSGEACAAWRADRVHGAGRARVADLCCGIGGDAIALTPALAADRDPVHARLTAHNVGVYDRPTPDLVVDDAENTPLTGIDVAFVDPARRSEGRRHPGRYSPSLDWCMALTRTIPAVVVKAAPGIDLATVPEGWEVEFVADGGELKEAVLWSPALAGADARRASVLPERACLTADAAGEHALVGEVGAYLLDPSPAVTRAGLVATLAEIVGGRQIDPQIAFLAADTPVATPFGRWWRVEASQPWHVGRLAATLRSLDVGAVDIRRRGLAGDVEAIRRRLQLRGSRRAFLAMTRVNDRPWAIVGTPIDGAW